LSQPSAIKKWILQSDQSTLSELIGRRVEKFEQLAEIFITHLKSSAKFSNALENINPYRLEGLRTINYSNSRKFGEPKP